MAADHVALFSVYKHKIAYIPENLSVNMLDTIFVCLIEKKPAKLNKLLTSPKGSIQIFYLKEKVAIPQFINILF